MQTNKEHLCERCKEPLESESKYSSSSGSKAPSQSSSEGQLTQRTPFQETTEPLPSTGKEKDLEIQNIAPSDNEHPVHDPTQQACLPHIEGVQLWILITVLCLGLLLSSLETTIIGTALISIASDLGDYGKSNWVVAAYLITYTGFLIIFARCSDLFGRRSTFMVALTFFVVFSLACGLAQTMNQLIIFRAFQGIGGAGLYSLAMGVATEVPGKVRGVINGLLSSVFAISSAAGPLIGGAITSNTTWRWVFLLNVPVGAGLMAATFWVFPKNAVPLKINLRSLGRIDWPGIALSLGAIVSLIFALQQGGTKHSWTSAPIIVPLVVQGVCWVAFVAWEILLTVRGSKTSMLPVWPARLFARRVIGSAMLTAFLTGIPFMTIIIFLPQRFQLENGLSPVNAGVRMLVYLLVSSFAAGLGVFICVMKNVLFPVLVVAIALQVLGLGLMSSLPTVGEIPARQYGYQAILGFGFGLSLSTLPLLGRMEVGHLDHAVNMGAITQIRILGGVVGIAIGDVILSSHVWSNLSSILDPEQLAALLRSTDNLARFTPEQVHSIREAYGTGSNFQFRIMMYIAIACLIISLGCFVRHPIEVADMEVLENKERAVLAAQALERAGGTTNTTVASKLDSGNRRGALVATDVDVRKSLVMADVPKTL